MLHWFRTGGGPCTLPNLGCLPIIVPAGLLALAIALLVNFCC